MLKLDDIALEEVSGGNGGKIYLNSFNFNKTISVNTSLATISQSVVADSSIGVFVVQVNGY